MRFAYLCCDFGVDPLGTGGSSVHLQEEVHALRQLGHVVKVFSPRVPEEGRPEESFQPMPLRGFADEVVRLMALEEMAAPGHLVKEWRALLYAEHAQKVLLPALAAFQPDLLYERYSLFAYAGVELARQLQVPHLLQVNAPLCLEQTEYRELVLRRTAQELERLILTSADALIVVSAPLEDHARRLGVPPSKINLLPNGVNAERFHPAISGQRVRSRYDLNGKAVIGFVGSLRAWHDLDTLLTAARLLSQTDARNHLLVVGRGPRTRELRQLKEPYITAVGAIAHHQVPEFMAAMDVVVIPYRSQAGDCYFSPLKLFEAMAVAKPIVGADLGQVAEVLVHGETGCLYEPGNAEDLAMKITAVLEMSDGGASLGAAARRWVVDRQTWERNAHRIEALARSLIGTVEMSRAK